MKPINAIEVSYYVSSEIARQKKPHIIGENLIKPCSLEIVEIAQRSKEKKKIPAVSLINSTAHKRIKNIVTDIIDQVIQEIKLDASGLFPIQLNESTDVATCFQLMGFVAGMWKRLFFKRFRFRFHTYRFRFHRFRFH